MTVPLFDDPMDGSGYRRSSLDVPHRCVIYDHIVAGQGHQLQQFLHRYSCKSVARTSGSEFRGADPDRPTAESTFVHSRIAHASLASASSRGAGT